MSTTFKEIDDNKFSIQFVISQFTSATNIYSRKNEFGGFNWSLRTKTTTDAKKKQNLAIYLRCDGNKSNLWNVDVSADFSLKKADGVVGETKTMDHEYKVSSSRGYRPFIDMDLLKSQGYIKDECITIECIVTINSTVGVQQKKRHNFEIKDPLLSDAVLIVDGKKFYANKGLLSTHSSVFRALLFPKSSTYTHTSKQKIDKAKHNEFEQFLQCIYSPQNVDKSNVESVLKLACRFRVDLLMDQCERFLISSDDINKSTKLKYAEIYQLSNLQAAVLDSIKDNAELKSLTSNTESLGDATIRALFKKLGDITF